MEKQTYRKWSRALMLLLALGLVGWWLVPLLERTPGLETGRSAGVDAAKKIGETPARTSCQERLPGKGKQGCQPVGCGSSEQARLTHAPETEESPTQRTFAVSVNFKVKIPVGAQSMRWVDGWALSFPRRIIVVGGSVVNVGYESMATPAIREGQAFFDKVLTIRVEGETLAIAVLMFLLPVDGQGGSIPGNLCCFAAHAVAQRGELANRRDILLEHNAPSRSISLLFSPECAGQIANFAVIRIDEGLWGPHDLLVRTEPRMWPSQAAVEFGRGSPNPAPIAFSEGFSTSVAVGSSGAVSIIGLPHGFALPNSVDVANVLLERLSAATWFLTTTSGTLLSGVFSDMKALLPYDGQAVAYLGSAQSALPQIELTGAAAPNPATRPGLRVFCRIPTDVPGALGRTPLGEATFDANAGLWRWTATSRIESHFGQRVAFTFEELGFARPVVEGTLQSPPAVRIPVSLPEKPWVAKASILDTTSGQLPVPIRCTISFSRNRPTHVRLGVADAAGNWSLSGLEGPSDDSPPENDNAMFSAEIDTSTLRQVLAEAYLAVTGAEASIDVSVIPDTSNTYCPFWDKENRVVAVTWKYSMTVWIGKEKPASLSDFVNSHELREPYLASIEKASRED